VGATTIVPLVIPGAPDKLEDLQLLVYADKDVSVSRQILAQKIWEPAESALFVRFVRAGDVVIDAGANIGYFSVLAARLTGPGGRIIAFEPAFDNFAMLMANIQLNRLKNVTPLCCALSNGYGPVVMHAHVQGIRDGDMILDPEHPAYALGHVTTTMRVDDLPRIGIDRVDFMKMDVQGAEPLLFRGGERLIARNRDRLRILFEFTPIWVRKFAGIAPEAWLRRLAADWKASFVDPTDGQLKPLSRDLQEFAALVETPDGKTWPAGHVWCDILLEPRAASRSIGGLPSGNIVEGDVDGLVRAHFFPDPAYEGVMVEVGAARPDYLSIGASFRALGWRVLSIEPNPDFAALHRARGHEIVEVACGEQDAEDVSFFVVNSKQVEYLGGAVTAESFSSLGIRGDYADLMRGVDVEMTEIKVAVRRLDRVLAENMPEVARIDIVSVDVEGWEMEVLRGLNFDVYRPKVLIIEHLKNGPKYEDVMREFGYVLWGRVEPNEIYVQPTEIPEGA
jgi:FkbM family methyltransferase